MRIILIFITIAIVSGLGYAIWQNNNQKTSVPESTPPVLPTEPPQQVLPAETLPGPNPENASYIIDGQAVTLIDGTAETPAAPGSASMVTTTLFGEPTMGELNGDGSADAAVTLVRDMGGSGVFYYQAAAIAQGNEYVGTNAELLGDRIAPQTTQIVDETIIANFAERAEGEPMTVQPSVAVSKYFRVMGTVLTEVSNPNQPQGQL